MLIKLFLDLLSASVSTNVHPDARQMRVNEMTMLLNPSRISDPKSKKKEPSPSYLENGRRGGRTD
jgi:hypothetical protein